MRIVIVDHEIYRRGVRLILHGFPEDEVVGEAGTARDAVRVIRAQRPDLVVLDPALPGLDGAAAIRRLRRCAPGVRILVLSVEGPIKRVENVLKAGARGYALKSDCLPEICRAFREVRKGHHYVAPALTRGVSSLPSEAGSSDRPAL
jgi:two-component system, NarL family, invasion response regulator UvrY